MHYEIMRLNGLTWLNATEVNVLSLLLLSLRQLVLVLHEVTK